MIIQAYGLHWNPEFITWKVPGKKAGERMGKVRVKGKQRTIDFWGGQGLYVLHREFQTIYVGRTTKQHLGKRLRDHLSDDLAGKWDSFSWFVLNKINITSASLGKPVGRKLKAAELIAILESLTIYAANPPLNRKRERLKGGSKVNQANSPKLKTNNGDLMGLMKQLARIEEEVKQLSKKH